MHWVPAVLYEEAGEHVQCTLCPARCRLREGQKGACGVRRGALDGMQTATFGSAVRHVGPIERKPLYHYKPGTPTLTLASPGCTFRCDYCVNHRISQYGRDGDVSWRSERVDVRSVVDEVAAMGGSVALSYTEPSLAMELTLELAEAGRERGVGVLWKSNGYLTPEATMLAAPALAAVNLDVKAARDRAHRALTGAPLAPVLDSLAAFHAAGVWVEVSTPLIPGVSTEPEQLAAIAAAVVAVSPAIPWHLLRFTPTYRRAGDAPTAPDALADAMRIGHDAGLAHVYVERALGEDGRATRCPGCGHRVVSRGIRAVPAVALRDGRCPRCATVVKGRW